MFRKSETAERSGRTVLGRRSLLIIAACILCAAGLRVAAPAPRFQGSRIQNPDTCLLDIEKMTGTDLYTMELTAGDPLRIHFETVKGSMRLEIRDPDGATLYAGNGKDTKAFTVNIPKDGCYTISLTAKQARGSVHISAERKNKS